MPPRYGLSGTIYMSTPTLSERDRITTLALVKVGIHFHYTSEPYFAQGTDCSIPY
jgi:hypothetical protein